MKTKTKILAASACLAVPVAVYAAVTNADNLDVGAGSTNVPTVNSAGVGVHNAASYHSLAGGSTCRAHNSSFAHGYLNDSKNMSGAVGSGNDVNWADPGDEKRCSFAAGTLNTVLGLDSMATGRDNDVTADRAAVFGYGLVTTENRSTVVGEHNEDKAGIRFAVGNGADYLNRGNALEVYKNGDVIVNKEQGDISTGIFGD